MKSLIFAILTLGASMMTMTAMAEDITVAEINLPGKAALEKAAVKLGELTGMPMLGTAATSLLESGDETVNMNLGKKIPVKRDEKTGKYIDIDEDIVKNAPAADPMEDGCILSMTVYGDRDREARIKGRSEGVAKIREIVPYDRMNVSFWVTDAGIDIKSYVEGFKVEPTRDVRALGADPLPKMAKDAVFSVAFGDGKDYSGQIERLVAAMKKHDHANEFDFLDCSTTDGFADIKLNLSKIDFAKIEDGIFTDVLNDVLKKALPEMPEPESLAQAFLQGVNITLTGVDCAGGTRSAVELFSGEDLAKCDCVATFSIYRIAKALLAVPTLFDAETYGKIAPFLATLPAGDGADIAFKCSMEGSTMNMSFRFTPAETKCLAALATTAFTIGQSGVQGDGKGDWKKMLFDLIADDDNDDDDNDEGVVKVSKTEASTTISVSKADEATWLAGVDSFSKVNVKNQKGEIVKRSYKVYKGKGDERKLVCEVCATPTEEDKEFDKKWLSGIELLSDRKDEEKRALEMVAYRRFARMALAAADDVPGVGSPDVKKRIVTSVVKDMQEEGVRPYIGKPGVWSLLRTIVNSPKIDVKTSEKSSKGGK